MSRPNTRLFIQSNSTSRRLRSATCDSAPGDAPYRPSSYALAPDVGPDLLDDVDRSPEEESDGSGLDGESLRAELDLSGAVARSQHARV